MKITALAADIYKYDLNEPTDTSIPSITQWLRTRIGDLNNLLNNGYTINSSYEIIDSSGVEIDLDASSIFKKLYLIYYLRKQSMSFLGANGVDSISQITQDGITFRGVERNGIAKTYNELYKEAKDELKSLVNNYKFNRARAGHVKGDDYISKYDVVDTE